MAGRGGPHAFVDDQRVQCAERVGQAAQVLVVVKRIAAGPVREANVRVVHALAVVVERLARVEQHVGNARHGDIGLHAVAALRQRRDRRGVVAPSVVGEGAQRVVVAAAGQSQLAECRGQHRAHPHGLFAVLRALQRMRDGDQYALADERARQIYQLRCGDVADGGRPGAVLDHAVAAAEQVVFKRVPTGAAAIDVVAVELAVRVQLVHEAEHQRGVGHRYRGDPFGMEFGRQVRAQGADVDEAATAQCGGEHRAFFGVAAHAARGDARILEGHAAEGEHHIGVLGQLLERHVLARDLLHRRDDMRQQRGRSTGAVGVDGAHVAADGGVQKTMDLALRVVKASGAGPTVGAAEDRLAAMGLLYPAQLVGQQVEHLVPLHLDIVIAAAPRVGTGAVVEPALAHHGPGHADRVAQRVPQVLDDRIGVRVLGVRLHAQIGSVPGRGKRTPMRTVGAHLRLACG